MTKLFIRATRHAVIALALGGLVAPVFALTPLPLSQQSITGNYMAGVQALADLRTSEASRYFMAAAQADWDNPILVERAFLAFAADGQIAQAATTGKHLLELDKQNELAELVIATATLKERRYGATEGALENLAQDSFAAITGSILKAWALVGQGKTAEAEKSLEALSEQGLDDFLVFHRALMAESAGETDKAIDLMTTAYDAEPTVPRTVEVYARMLANAKRFEEAHAVIDKFEAQGLTHPLVTVVKAELDAKRRPGVFATSVQVGAAEMYHGIGVALARDGSLDLAVVFLRLGMYLDPNADVAAVALASILDTAKQHDEANAIYESIRADSPMKPLAIVRIATNLDAQGDRPEAIRRLSNIVATEPNDLDAVSVLGDLYRYDEQFGKAIDAYSKAIALSGGERPNDWRFFYVRGIAYERDKQWPKAEADLQAALKLNPDQPQVLNYLGYSWVDQGLNLQPALEMIEKAVAAQPQDGYIIDSLGWAFYRLGRIDEAVSTLEQAVQLLPNDPELNDHLGDAYWKAGRKLEAKFQWNIAASVDEAGTVKERVASKLTDGLTDENATK